MPEWVPTTIVLAHAGIVILLALAAVFSETGTRRTAAYKVLRVMLPWCLIIAVASALMQYFGLGGPPQ
jgi:hypothetical protein